MQAISIHRRKKLKAGNLTGYLEILKRIGDLLHMSQAGDHMNPVQCFDRKYRVLRQWKSGSQTQGSYRMAHKSGTLMDPKRSKK